MGFFGGIGDAIKTVGGGAMGIFGGGGGSNTQTDPFFAQYGGTPGTIGDPMIPINPTSANQGGMAPTNGGINPGGGSYAGGVGDPTGGTQGMTPEQMFRASMDRHGLTALGVQKNGASMVAALKADYPGLDIKVDPTTDALVWPGIGSLDVTMDSGKGGWSFRPDGYINADGTPGANAGGGGGFGESGAFLTPFTESFQARDPNQIKNDPAYQFQMQQGLQGIERSAASRGTLLTGGTMKALEGFGQGLASTYNDKYYNRDVGEYGMRKDLFQQNQDRPFSKSLQVSQLGKPTP